MNNKQAKNNRSIGKTLKNQSLEGCADIYVPSKPSKSSYSISSIFPDAKTRKLVLTEVKKICK